MDDVKMVDAEVVGESQAIEDKYNRLENDLYGRQRAEFSLDEKKQLCKLALKRKSLEILKLVFSRRCVLSCDNELDLTANRELISSAIESDFVEGLVYLYDRGLVLESDDCTKYNRRLESNPSRWNALIEAVQKIKYKSTEYLLSIASVISSTTLNEILTIAITRKNTPMVKFLLRRIDTPIYLPLIYLCLCDDEEYAKVVDEEARLELIKVLVDAGSYLNNICNEQIQTPLMLAAEKGLLAIFNYLLDNGAAVNCTDEKNQNVLHYLILSDSDTSSQIERVINYWKSIYKSVVKKNFLMPYIRFAVKHGKFQRATHLMGIRPVDVTLVDDYTETNLLHLVALHNSDQSVEFAQLLIRREIDVNLSNCSGKTPLLTACVNNNINIIRLLLEVGCDVNVKDHMGSSALMIAVEREDMELAELLLTRGADVNTRDNSSISVLMKAAEYQNVELVKLLTKYNADVNVIDARGENVCGYCFHKQDEGGRKSSFDLVKLFIDQGFNIDKVNYENKIFYTALGANDLLSFELLLNSITKPDRVNEKGDNIFHILSTVNGFPCSKIEKLFENEKLQNEKNKNGCTPIMQASFLLNGGYLDVIKTDGGIRDLDIQNKNGHTALHMCMLGFMGNRGENRVQFRECVKSLLIAGSNVNIQDNNGVTALMMAAMIEDKILINYCMKFGADITILDYKYEMSALQYLDFKSSCDCLPELLSKDRNALVNLPGKDGNTLIQRALLFPLFWDPLESVDIISYLCAVNCNLQHLQSVSTARNYFTEDIDLDDLSIDERDRLRKLLYLSGAHEEEIVLSLNFKRENKADGFSDDMLHSRHLEQFNLFCNNISLQSRCRRVIRQIVGSRLHTFIVASNIKHLQDFLFLKQSRGGERHVTLYPKYFVTHEDQIGDRGSSNGDRPTDVDFDDTLDEYDEDDGSGNDTDVDFDDTLDEYDEGDGSGGDTDVDFDDVFLSLIDSMYGHVKYINTGPRSCRSSPFHVQIQGRT
ncbi:hypothetical protein SNE40_006421 [Patella caerulea]|uniref:Uncharacterized protein n=1 Tax=Patella caerulea TaxID=87958 RepID=A0AAN8JU00_PATCE